MRFIFRQVLVALTVVGMVVPALAQKRKRVVEIKFSGAPAPKTLKNKAKKRKLANESPTRVIKRVEGSEEVSFDALPSALPKKKRASARVKKNASSMNAEIDRETIAQAEMSSYPVAQTSPDPNAFKRAKKNTEKEITEDYLN